MSLNSWAGVPTSPEREQALFKTEMCNWVGTRKGCQKGTECTYAHSLAEMRPTPARLAVHTRRPDEGCSSQILFVLFYLFIIKVIASLFVV